MRFLRQSLTGLLLASLTLGLVVYAGYLVSSAIQTRMSAEPRVPPARERVFAVNVLTAQAGPVTPILEVFGEIESHRRLQIRAAVGGRVVELAEGFIEGGDVRAGEVLARIDPADMQAALARANSDLADAQAEIRDAARALEIALDEQLVATDQARLQQQALDRQNDLLLRGAGTASSVENAELASAAARQALLSRRQAVAQAQTRVDQAATRLTRAEIALDEAQRNLDDTTITADFDGTLSNVSVVRGGLVAANEQMADLIDGRALEVAFRVSTAQYSRLIDQQGTLLRAPATVILDVAEAELSASARIERDGAVAGDGQTGRVIFARLDSAPAFKPGDFVTVRVEEPLLKEVVRLPAAALGSDETVLVLGSEDRLEALPVRLLRRQGDDVLVRADGLDGREVVATRTPLLGPGIVVRPLRAQANADSAAQAGQVDTDATALVTLTEERRAALVARVEADAALPDADKQRILAQLAEAQVPAGMIARIEGNQGG